MFLIYCKISPEGIHFQAKLKCIKSLRKFVLSVSWCQNNIQSPNYFQVHKNSIYLTQVTIMNPNFSLTKAQISTSVHILYSIYHVSHTYIVTPGLSTGHSHWAPWVLHLDSRVSCKSTRAFSGRTPDGTTSCNIHSGSSSPSYTHRGHAASGRACTCTS